MSEPLNGADLLARIRPQKRRESVQICLRPDLIDEFIEAEETLLELRAKSASPGGGRMADRPADEDSPEAVEQAEKVREIEERVLAASITFEFEAMDKDAWSSLCDEHPPRAKNVMDHQVGYDRDAVLDAAVRKCLVDPVFDDASWAELVKHCNDGEWTVLKNTVNSVNRGVVDAPKSALASQILDRLGSTSR